MRKLRLPRTDPARQRKVSRPYEAALVKLFQDFKPYALRTLKISAGIREMEAGKPNLDLFVPSISQYADLALKKKAKAIIEKETKDGFYQGKEFAIAVLNAHGYKAQSGISFNLPVEQSTLKALQSRNLAAFDKITNEMDGTIKREITDGLLKGESIDQMAKRLTDSIDNVGIVRARAMARTETAYAVNQGTITEYKNAGIEKMEWLTAHDERTCPTCRPLNGKIVPDQTDGYYPPRHVNCRCCLVPHVEVK